MQERHACARACAHLVSSPVSAGCPSKLRLRRWRVGASRCTFRPRCCWRRVRAACACACVALCVAGTACACVPPRLWRAPLLRFALFFSSSAALLFNVATGSPPHSGQHGACLCVACTGAGDSDLYAENLIHSSENWL